MPYLEIKNEDSGERQIEYISLKGVDIGRSKTCDIFLDIGSVSKVHARIKRSSGNWYIEDPGSRNGFLVNGEKTEFHWLRDKDIISLPHYKITFFSDEIQKGKNDIDAVSQDAARSEGFKAERLPAHPYALAAIIFLLLTLLHWTFSLSGVILAVLALFHIRRSNKYRGKLIAIAALGGGTLIALTSFFIHEGGMEMLLVPNPIETHCRKNMEVIWKALQNYRNDENRYPGDLSDLYPNYVPVLNNLSCPGKSSDEIGAGYLYAGNISENSDADSILLIDASTSQHEKNNALVLYANGRIKRVGIREHQYLLLQLE